jgi:hypothetical protein
LTATEIGILSTRGSGIVGAFTVTWDEQPPSAVRKTAIKTALSIFEVKLLLPQGDCCTAACSYIRALQVVRVPRILKVQPVMITLDPVREQCNMPGLREIGFEINGSFPRNGKDVADTLCP